jgi:protein-tyrosine phosphatase
MIDLHTHLLPDWDDGPADDEAAERMISVAKQDGITQAVLTPHVFRMTKHGDSLEDLKSRIVAFVDKAEPLELALYAGAEVHIHPDMIDHIKKYELTINGSSFVFIEVPAEQVPAGTSDLVYAMQLEGLIPIISHPERNSVFARSPEVLYKLVRQGALVQLTAMSLTGGFGTAVQNAAETFLRNNLAHVIASDAHDSENRPPRLSAGVEAAAKVVGPARARAMVTTVPEAIIRNEPVPEFGEPSYPPKKKNKFGFRFR